MKKLINIIKRWTNRKKLYAVHTEDLEILLRSAKIYETLTKGDMQCSICNKQVTLENIQCIYSDNGAMKVCCDEINCYKIAISKVIT